MGPSESRSVKLAVLVVALLAVVGFVVAPAVGLSDGFVDGGASEQGNGQSEGGEAASTEIEPGERVAGVVGTQGAELEGEIDERAFGVAVAQAESDEARADVVADRIERIEHRLDEHERRAAELEDQREAGEISEGQYRAKMARLDAEVRTTHRLANASGQAAADLPEEVREERGVDAEKLDTLRERAGEVGGPELREIARSIAGPEAGQPMGGPQAPGQFDADDDDDDNGPGQRGSVDRVPDE